MIQAPPDVQSGGALIYRYDLDLRGAVAVGIRHAQIWCVIEWFRKILQGKPPGTFVRKTFMRLTYLT